MKKTYINPTAIDVQSDPEELLSSSVIQVGNDYDGSETIESRQSSDFDWDEEEEE